MRSRWLLLFAGWTLFGLVQTMMRTVINSRSDGALLTVVVFFLPLAWIWAALTPAVGWWARVIDRRFRSLPLRVMGHVPFLAATAILHTFLRRALIVAMGDQVTVPFSVTFVFFADITIVSYLLAVWASRTMDAQRQLVERERQAERLRLQVAAAQLEHLELQLHPHFLFNTLGTVAELAHEAPANAARMLQNVIALLDSGMAREQGGLVYLGEELEAVQPYLAIQRLRFEDWLEIEEDATENAKRAIVPKFILQPLIENAVHHGLINRSARGRIVIRARTEGDRLLVSVTDNGTGLNAPSYHASRGMGLANLRARLEVVYGTEASVQLHQEPGGGTAATLSVPQRPRTNHGTPTSGKEDPVDDGPPDNGDRNRDNAAIRWSREHPYHAIVVSWTGVTLMRALYNAANLNVRGRFEPDVFWDATRHDVVMAALWMAFTPLVMLAARRVPLRRCGITPRLGFHALAAFLLAVAHVALMRLLARDSAVPLWSISNAQAYAWNVSVYALLVVIAHFRDVQRWVRERTVGTARLRRELQEARLQKVMLELRPTVLRNALHHVVSIIGHDITRAEAILEDAGAFLRTALDTIGQRDVPLAQETAAVKAYGRVLCASAFPALQFELSIPRDLMDHRVPNGVLRAVLDAVLDMWHGGPLEARVQVAADLRGLFITASAYSTNGSTPRVTDPHRLQEYQEQGLLDILEYGSGSLALRLSA